MISVRQIISEEIQTPLKVLSVLVLVLSFFWLLAPPQSTGAQTAPVTIFLTDTQASTWTVPSDWNNASNTIEVIGGGGGGSAANDVVPGSSPGEGGGGGGYSKVTDISLTPGATVSYSVGLGGAGRDGTSPGDDGGDTYLCNTTSSCSSIADSAVVVGAKGGTGGTTDSGIGGTAASGVGSTKYSGGNGSPTAFQNGGKGAGGAGGPYGNGGTGSDPATAASGLGGGGNGGGTNGGAYVTYGAPGGNAYDGTPGGLGGGSPGADGHNGVNGSGGGGGGSTADGTTPGKGGNGGNGIEWDATHGSGGGGGGGAEQYSDNPPSAAGGNGGLYGGGGGGGGYAVNNSGAPGGNGAQGIIVITYTPVSDSTPPTPNPATFSSAPSADGTASISMTATTATDESTPVEYLFTYQACASNNGTGGTSSGWQTSTSYSDSGLEVGKCYAYTVTTRDALGNTGSPSTAVEAVTDDTEPPTPNPMTFAYPPLADGPTAISMIADTATDESTPVEYKFTYQTCSSNNGSGGTSSGWQTSTSYTDSSLEAGRCYAYSVTARDALGNTTASSTVFEATTQSSPGNWVPITGYAWSDTIGWIDLHCQNSGICASNDWGLEINTGSEISGYAWSDNIGWISARGPDVSGCPSSPCSASIDQGQLHGWLRALSAFVPVSDPQPVTETFTTAGSDTFTVPDYETLTVKVWGAGGGGGSAISSTGAAGGENGGQSSFNAGTPIVAGGGSGGTGGDTSGVGTGGIGGTASGGDTNTTGGSGGNASSVPYAGGVGGDAPSGGTGGAGGTSDNNGSAGSTPGAGGGGASYSTQTTAGGGGGSGAYSEKTFSAGDLSSGSSIDITVGAGGAGGSGDGAGASYIFVTDEDGDQILAYTFNGISFSQVASYPINRAYAVWGDGTYIYVSSLSNSIYALSFDGSGFTPRGSVNTDGDSVSMSGDGTYIYTAEKTSGVNAYIFDGSSFIEVGTPYTTSTRDYLSVWSDGVYVYSGDNGGNLRAFRFNGSNFTQLDLIDTIGTRGDVWGDGTYIYHINENFYAQTFNGSSFSNVDSSSNSGVSVWGDGTYIYTAAADANLRAYTITGGTLTLKGTLNLVENNPTRDIWGDGTYIYVADGNGGIRAFSFNGSSFNELESDTTAQSARSVWVSGSGSNGYSGGAGANGRIEVTYTPTASSETGAGGWDGWISLSGSTYGVTGTSTGDFEGYAWGSDVIGWVEFSGAHTDYTACEPVYFCVSDKQYYRDQFCVEKQQQVCEWGCDAGACLLPPPPTPKTGGYGNNGYLQAVPRLLREGSTSRLYWEMLYADTCTVSGNGNSWSGPSYRKSPASGKETNPVNEQVTYTLQCTGDGGVFTDTENIYIVPTWQEI